MGQVGKQKQAQGTEGGKAPPCRSEGGRSIRTRTWAALLAVNAHNQTGGRKIMTVAFPALGTGFGGVAFDEAARQMAVAYRHYLEPPSRFDWEVVANRHKAICYDGNTCVVR